MTHACATDGEAVVHAKDWHNERRRASLPFENFYKFRTWASTELTDSCKVIHKSAWVFIDTWLEFFIITVIRSF